MRAAVARRGQMVVDDIDDPVPSSGEALVAVKACGICGSDLHTLRHAHSMLALASMTGAGTLCGIASVAGFRGLPGAPAYCASKAAVRVWGEALRADWAGRGVRINVICPGYVTTRMTAKNDFPMPFLMPAEKAARIMLDGLRRDKARIAFPWPLYAVVRLISAIPPGFLDPILRRLPRK